MCFIKASSICIILFTLALSLPANLVYAQYVPIEHLKKSTAMNGRVSFLATERLKKANKKMLKHFKPMEYSTDAMGYLYKEGMAVLLYKTDMNWNNDDNGLSVWKIMHEITNKTFNNHSFIEAGYFESETSSSITYFIKVSFEDEQKTFGILTFLEMNGKMFYVLLLSEKDINSEWARSLDVVRNNRQ